MEGEQAPHRSNTGYLIDMATTTLLACKGSDDRRGLYAASVLQACNPSWTNHCLSDLFRFIFR
jgi:hypothetical protein